MEKALAIAFFWFGSGLLGSLVWIANLSKWKRADEVDWKLWALAVLGPIHLFVGVREWLLDDGQGTD